MNEFEEKNYNTDGTEYSPITANDKETSDPEPIYNVWHTDDYQQSNFDANETQPQPDSESSSSDSSPTGVSNALARVKPFRETVIVWFKSQFSINKIDVIIFVVEAIADLLFSSFPHITLPDFLSYATAILEFIIGSSVVWFVTSI